MGNRAGMYGFVESVQKCYKLLQDRISRDIFEARLVLDCNPSPANISRLVSLSEQRSWLDALSESIPAITCALNTMPRKLVLYGTNVTGCAIASLLEERGVEFYGFCGRRTREFPGGLMEKPVILPERLFQSPEEFYVIVAACESASEIAALLKEYGFPEEQILFNFKPAREENRQYFDFPTLFRRGTAFVDAGCLNCHTSYQFVEWCGGDYSKIFAFEPDPISASICRENLSARDIQDFQLIEAGLSDHVGTTSFHAGLYNGSHIVEEGSAEADIVTLPLTTIDQTVGEEQIGFVKMDIEGAEYDALHGAKGVIVRDKPLLALSVYHRIGDMLAIMDYLHHLVPKYLFWLRHYSVGLADTVLYAAVGEDNTVACGR